MFNLFNELPVEIRLQIWETAFPSSGVLQIKEKLVREPLCDQEEIMRFGTTSSRHQYRDITQGPEIVAPAKFFANKESRQAALKYDLRTSALASPSLETSFDFDIDTIYLQFNLLGKLDADDWFDDIMQRLETLTQSEDFVRVRKLAILLKLNGTNNDCRSYLMRIWQWFGCLGEFEVMVKHFEAAVDEDEVVVYVKPVKALPAEPVPGTRLPNMIVAMILVLALELEKIFD